MDIHVDIREFLEIHAWICYGFSDQGRERELCIAFVTLSELQVTIRVQCYILHVALRRDWLGFAR